MRRVWLVLLALLVLGMAQRVRPRFVPQRPSQAVANPMTAARMPSNSTTLPDAVWAAAGVLGGIPSGSWANCNNTACDDLAPGGSGTVSAATINAALSGAQVGGVACAPVTNPCVVRIRAGSFTLTAGINMVTGRALRGAGPSQTLLDVNGAASNGCGYGTWNAAVAMCSGGSFSDTDVTWSAGYSKGTTTITLPNCTGITAGLTPLHLNQLSETDGYPATGDLFICDTSGTCNSAGADGAGSPGGMGLAGRAPALEVLATACSSGSVTIMPPISMDNFRGAKTPQAHYPTTGTLQWAGLEDLSIDQTDAGNAGIEWINTTNCWMRNVRLVNNGSAAFGIALGRSSHVTIRDSYIFRDASSPESNYAVSLMAVGSLLFENNILQGEGSAVTTDNSLSNSVFAYNFGPGTDGPMFIRHLAGEVQNLIEGNIIKGVWSDAEDGTGCCWTVYRNGFIGNRYNAGGASTIQSALMLVSNSRFWNVAGNVLGDASAWTVYAGQTNGGCSTAANMYDLGGTSCGGGGVVADARVAATLFRWGNWDEITSTSPTTNGDQTGTRWCGTSANTGWVARCGSASEVPSGITNYANTVPVAEALPSSLYLSSKPSWFGPVPYPPIGPDISGGNVTSLGGHVYLNPAAVCYLTTMSGPADGSGGALTFSCW